MVRVKQTFSDSKASCSSTTLQNYDGLKAPDKSGDTGSKLPYEKAVKPVQDSESATLNRLL